MYVCVFINFISGFAFTEFVEFGNHCRRLQVGRWNSLCSKW